MSYVNADDVLPKFLLEEIHKYIDGQLIYIPRKNGKSLSERNRMIVKRYYLGESISELGEMYYLSEKIIRGIIHEYESSKRNTDGGFKSE